MARVASVGLRVDALHRQITKDVCRPLRLCRIATGVGQRGRSTIRPQPFMASLPKSVKVGPHAYRILVVPGSDLKDEDGNELNGDCDVDDLEIRLRKGMRHSKKQEILLHEVTHAVAKHAGVDDKTLGEESWIDVVSPVLLQVLRENPDLVRFLTSDAPRKSPRKTPAKAVPDNPGAGGPDVREAGQQVQDLQPAREEDPAKH